MVYFYGLLLAARAEVVAGRGLELVSATAGARRRDAIGQEAGRGDGRESGRAGRMTGAGNAAGGVPVAAVAVAPTGIEAAVSGTTGANLLFFHVRRALFFFFVK